MLRSTPYTANVHLRPYQWSYCKIQRLFRKNVDTRCSVDCELDYARPDGLSSSFFVGHFLYISLNFKYLSCIFWICRDENYSSSSIFFAMQKHYILCFTIPKQFSWFPQVIHRPGLLKRQKFQHYAWKIPAATPFPEYAPKKCTRDTFICWNYQQLLDRKLKISISKQLKSPPRKHCALCPSTLRNAQPNQPADGTTFRPRGL